MSYHLVRIDTGETVRVPDEIYYHMMDHIRTQMYHNVTPTIESYRALGFASKIVDANPEYVTRRTSYMPTSMGLFIGGHMSKCK